MSKRFHVHLHVDDLAHSVGFYNKLFAATPARQETDYAKWMLDDPPVNFAISTWGNKAGIDHLGFQTDDAGELADMHARADAADLAPATESGTCCYARSDKHWVTDPQGIAWEHFHTLADISTFNSRAATAAGACCPKPVAAEPVKLAARTTSSLAAHILILCTHNSARSVLAEAMLNHWAGCLGRDVRAHSAGSAPSGRVNPFALEVLAAAGIDAGAPQSKGWDAFAAPGAPPLAAVITVCDSAARETCPFFPGAPVQVHWGYPDPSNVEGGMEAKRRAFELTRQALGYRMLQLLALPIESMDAVALRSALQTIGRT